MIQTSAGLKPIEDIKVGDLVVSMNTETAEISTKPVNRSTVRSTDHVWDIELENGTSITATGGHYWWVTGLGWKRTRELEPGMQMRNATASITVSKVGRADRKVDVYNCIVDENHTYFVGPDRVLSWDVTNLKPTLQTVPGIEAETLLSKSK